MPVEIGLPAPVTHIAAGADFSCAVLATGSVSCWGTDLWGELGDGTN